MNDRPDFVRSASVDGTWIQVNGLWVRYRQTGPIDAPAVVLQHHFHANVDTWRHIHALLADYRVVSFDRPGFGFTERPPRYRWRFGNPYTRAFSARLTVGLLNRLGIERATMVGASAGGTIALETLDRFPDRVEGLVLISPAITGDAGAPPTWRPVLRAPLVRSAGANVVARASRSVAHARVGRWWHDPGRVTDEDVAIYRRPMAEARWAQGLYEAMVAEPPPDLRRVLGGIEVAALVAGGASDALVPPYWNERTARAIAHADLLVVDDAGHTPHEERPEILAAALREFLGTINRLGSDPNDG